MLPAGVHLSAVALILLSAAAAAVAEGQHGQLHVEFVSYAVPDSRQANGHYCDGIKLFTWERRISACDPQINLCVGAADPKSCTVGKIALPWISNSDTVTFGPRIGSTSNPVSLPFTDLPETLSIRATIYDHDRIGSSDLIDTITSSLRVGQKKKALLISGRTHLQLRMWFTCAANYYGSQCNLFNHCHSNPCANGRCMNQPDGYKCFCLPGWTGARCDEEKAADSDPCAGRKATRFHECRVRYKGGRPQIYAVEHSTNPVAKDGLCVTERGRKVLTGAAAKGVCRG